MKAEYDSITEFEESALRKFYGRYWPWIYTWSKRAPPLLLILLALPAFAQRGGGATTVPFRNLLPDCTAITGACPSDNYFCLWTDNAIYRCAAPNTWTVTVASTAAIGTDTQVIFNNAGTNSGSSGLIWDETNTNLIAKRIGNDFYCAADWDGDGSRTNDAGDLLACLDASQAVLTTAENGTDNVVNVHLADGYFDFCEATLPGGNPCPYTLKSGTRLYGEKPRLLDYGTDGTADDAQDLHMFENGGTWIDGNGTASASGVFTGGDVRGVDLYDFGIYNYAKGLIFGAAGSAGPSWSTWRDLYFIGNTMAVGETTSAFVVTNLQHMTIDNIRAYRCSDCFKFVNDHDNFQGGNSEARGLFAYMYQTSAPAGQKGVDLVCTNAGSGPGNLLNLIKFNDVQINNYSTVGYNVYVGGTANCKVNGMDFNGYVCDGSPDACFYARSLSNSYLMFGTSNRAAVIDVDMDSTCSENTLVSAACHSITPTFGIRDNMFFGCWEGTSGEEQFAGIQRDAFAASPGVQVVADRGLLGWTTGTTSGVDLTSLHVNSNLTSTDTDGDGPDFITIRASTVNTAAATGKSDTMGVDSRMYFGGGAGATNQTFDQNYISRSLLDGITSTGTGVVVNDLDFYRAAFGGNWLGSNWRVDETNFFHIPILTSSYAGGSFTTVRGIYIEDMAGLGTATSMAIKVDSQTGADALKGNVNIAGTGFDTGHLTLGNNDTGAHVWESGGTLYGKVGAKPTTDTDGTNLLAASTGDITSVWDDLDGAVTNVAFLDTEGIDASATPGGAWSAAEGITLPQTTTVGCAVAGTKATGAICYDSTTDALCVWDSADWDCQTVGALTSITAVYDCTTGDCGDVVAADADSIDFSATPGGGWTTGEGVIVSQAATCTGAASSGALCYATTANQMCISDGASGWDCWGDSEITDVFDCASGNCTDIVVGAADSLDFSGTTGAGGQGLILPQSTTCNTGSTPVIGQFCYDTTTDYLFVFDGLDWDSVPIKNGWDGVYTAADAGGLNLSATPGGSWTGEGLVLPQSTTVDCNEGGTPSTGSLCYDSTTDAICVYDSAGWDCLTLGASASIPSMCKTIENLGAGDDNLPLWSVPTATTLVTGYCQCIGTCTPDLAIVQFERDDGTPATIAGGSATCTARATGDPTPVTFSGGEAALGTYDILRMDVTNTPTAGDTYIVCWTW